MEEDTEYTRPLRSTHKSDEPGMAKMERKTVEMNGKAPERLPSMDGRVYPPGALNGVKTFREYYTPIRSEPKTMNMVDVIKNRYTFNTSTEHMRTGNVDKSKKTPPEQIERARTDKLSLLQGRGGNGFGISGYDSNEMGVYTKSKIETAKLVDDKPVSFLNSSYNTVLISIIATSVFVYLFFKIRQ